MENIPYLFSLLFFLTATTYLFFGIYVIRINPKSDLNRLFLLICLALSIWSFGFAMGNIASTIETALAWRRFTAIGWVSVHSLTLHFLLLLTCKDCPPDKKRLFFLLHLPIFIGLSVFTFSTPMAAIQYDLVKTNFGWANLAAGNVWNSSYLIYYTSYTLGGLFLTWSWKKKSTDQKIIQQANFIFMAILMAIILGSVSDVVLNLMLKLPFPQLSPLFILIPVFSIYYAVRYYHLLAPPKSDHQEMVLTETDQKKIFKILALTFCIGSLLFLLFELLPSNPENPSLKTTLMISTLLFSIGLAIFLTQKIKNEKKRDVLTIIILTLSIPLITLQFLEHSGLTMWVFPVLIMISSLVFTKRTLLIATCIVAIITQALLWILSPGLPIVTLGYDYFLRMLIFLFVFLIGFYVNRIYMAKIKENRDQIAFQKLSSNLSLDFVSLTQDNFNTKINDLLKHLGLFFQVDRTYLFLIDHENSTMTYTHEWCNDGIEAEVGTIEKIPLSVFPWWIAQLNDHQLVYIDDVHQMPLEARKEQDQLIRQKVKSLVSLPIEGDDKVQGFIGIDSVTSFKRWSSEHLEMLTILCNLIAQRLIKRRSDKKIEFMAYYDHLTHLPNRILFADRLTQTISVAKRNTSFVGVIFIDLDNFKAVNDTIGHNGGDDLLTAVAQRLLAHVRETDTVCRFGGDEFLMMFSNIHEVQAIPEIAKKVMALFSEPFTICEQEFFITASAGISVSFIDGEDANTLIKNADLAMYKAKAQGKNQFALCTSEMKVEVQQSMMLSNDLYRALERDQLLIYYQPQIDLHTNRIKGIEALLRWDHPDYGMISPAIFIPIAEKSNLIITIGNWVLKTSAAQNKKWQDMGFAPLTMAVNLSGIQFINAQVVQSVQSILTETGLDPKYFELEITESIAIQDTNYTITVLNQLKELGVSIAIDDFGTAYSSLNRLKFLPIDRIKIDMQFIQGLEDNVKDQAITSVIINLAKSLGLSVIAEGVETLGQVNFLKQNKCDSAQGFYYHKPIPAPEIEEILRRVPQVTRKTAAPLNRKQLLSR